MRKRTKDKIEFEKRVKVAEKKPKGETVFLSDEELLAAAAKRRKERKG